MPPHGPMCNTSPLPRKRSHARRRTTNNKADAKMRNGQSSQPERRHAMMRCTSEVPEEANVLRGEKRGPAFAVDMAGCNAPERVHSQPERRAVNWSLSPLKSALSAETVDSTLFVQSNHSLQSIEITQSSMLFDLSAMLLLWSESCGWHGRIQRNPCPLTASGRSKT